MCFGCMQLDLAGMCGAVFAKISGASEHGLEGFQVGLYVSEHVATRLQTGHDGPQNRSLLVFLKTLR